MWRKAEPVVLLEELLILYHRNYEQIIVAGVVFGHVASKYVYVRIFRSSPEKMHQRSLLSVGTWLAVGTAMWTIAWVIAESIPVFSDLLSLVVCSLLFWVYIPKAMID